MATMATFFRRPEVFARAGERKTAWPRVEAKAHAQAQVQARANPYALRELPGENVFFYSKRIDNSRLVRAADPASGGTCWTAIGASSAVAALLLSILVPSLGGILAGYRIQSLRAEQQQLVNERRVLELQESRLLSPARLEQLAGDRNLSNPAAGQVVRLEGSPDGSHVAQNLTK